MVGVSANSFSRQQTRSNVRDVIGRRDRVAQDDVLPSPIAPRPIKAKSWMKRRSFKIQHAGESSQRASGGPWDLARAPTRTVNRSDVHGDSCVINPSSKWTRKWDLIMVLALGFTAIVTPVEVAFLDEGQYITTLWMVNRFVDLSFVIDMVISFSSNAGAEPADLELGGSPAAALLRVAGTLLALCYCGPFALLMPCIRVPHR